ncbi:hypothetical protein ACTMSW_28395 [Micromonospora sp. BQ11]|uniref:hypothetical protein n=1 Tax=Micromonospora sp. BQ11 TaxID=3452212 RepID=UPI003F8B6E08
MHALLRPAGSAPAPATLAQPAVPPRPATPAQPAVPPLSTARTTTATAVRRLAPALVLPLVLVACGSDQPETAPATPTPGTAEVSAGTNAARDELAGLAAAAQDRHLVAAYVLRAPEVPDRTVVVTSANDGSWRVDVPGGALGGTTDVSFAATADGLFQCTLPSATRPEPPACVRLGDRDDAVPRRLDPRVQHPFTDWLDVLTDRRSPLAVSPAQPPPGAAGTCYSVETTSASITAPLDPGIYCYDADGTPTAVRTALGTLLLTGTPAPAPASVQLPGPVVEAEPLPLATPEPTVSPETS